MNIFYVDENPCTAASMLVDKHVVKMILEGCQLLSTAHHILNSTNSHTGIYKQTHKNHPSAVWVRQSYNHYDWLFHHTVALSIEYTYRYGKIHKSREMLTKILIWSPVNIPDSDSWTDPPKCMPDEFKVDSTVESYRNYYRIGKKHLLKYTNRNPPDWLNND